MYFVIPHPYFLPAVYIALKSEASVFGFREDAAVRRIHVLHVTSNGLLATSVSSGHRTPVVILPLRYCGFEDLELTVLMNRSYRELTYIY